MITRRENNIKLPIQLGNLQKLFPGTLARVRKGQLIWIGRLTPSPLSRSYSVRLQYREAGTPDVEVLDPQLQDRDGVRPPHMYSRKRLCLYLPGAYEWSRRMWLSETIIPWTSEWLLNYEIWLATGEWCGGGEHPPSDSDPPPEPVDPPPTVGEGTRQFHPSGQYGSRAHIGAQRHGRSRPY
jgi:hypothetical protein